MPKVVYSSKKGLVQSAGSGFQVNDVAILEDVQALTDPVTPVITPRGTTTFTITAGSLTSTLAAPTAAEPAGVKKVITCLLRSGGSMVVTLTGGGIQDDGSSALATLTYNATGETYVLVSNGSKWVGVANAGATEG